MTMKAIGVVFIVIGCGGCGFYAAASGKREMKMLKGLLRLVCFMESQLKCNPIPLPALFRETAKLSEGVLKEVFEMLADELELQTHSDVSGCMASAIEVCHSIPQHTKALLLQMGQTLGRFDLSGQLKELEQLSVSCEKELSLCVLGHENRFRGYRTFGLCAGAFLVILLL